MAGRGATTKLFVGNIPVGSNQSELRELFAKFGTVMECDIIKDYAFVHFADVDDAKDAIENLDQAQFNGAKIKVEMSSSRVRSKPGMGDREKCFRCGEFGHWSRDCPTDRGSGRTGNGGGPMPSSRGRFSGRGDGDAYGRGRDDDIYGRGDRYASSYSAPSYLASGYLPPDYPSRAAAAAAPPMAARYHPYAVGAALDRRSAGLTAASAASSYMMDEFGRPTPEYYAARRMAGRSASSAAYDYGSAGSRGPMASAYNYGSASRVPLASSAYPPMRRTPPRY